jgi:polyferredoxin
MDQSARFAAILGLSILMLVPLVAVGQEFGGQGSFGEVTTDRTYQTDPAPSATERTSSYFLHDQLTKLLLVLGFTLAGLLIVLKRRLALRKPLLLASVLGLGFAIGGALCPLAAVQNVILKASTGYLILFIVPTVSAALFGRLFCGYVCPFGALQELLHIRRLRIRIPAQWLRRLRVVPFVLLAYLVARTIATGVLSLSELTPFKAFFTLGGAPLTLAVSGLFAVASVFVFRPFCTGFCPLGAWLSLVARVSPFRLRRTEQCVECARCDAVCSVQAVRSGRVSASRCLLCGDCVRACPLGALHVAASRGGAASAPGRR